MVAKLERTGSVANHPGRGLPDKLCISSWIWSWITSATPGEPYDDLDRCMVELKERSFNAIRVEAGLNWAFTLDGQPRGEMEFGPWIPDYSWNASSANARGGGRLDVLQRLFSLFELAAKHDIRVILTSWEYQDSSWFVADPDIRRSILGVPVEDRFMHLAKQHDRLLTMLKERRLSESIAFVEVHNEPEHSEMSSGPEGVALHEVAIRFLQERHPDILVSADFSSHDPSLVPENAQVYDQHVYAGARWYFEDLYHKTVRDPAFDPANPRSLAVMDRILRSDIVPWDVFMRSAQNIREHWRDVNWLYENLDNDQWDEWILERFDVWEERIRDDARSMFASDAAEAQKRSLPLVIDEGGFFCPPRLSRFEITPRGLAVLELFADLAIEHGYWGFMPGTYSGPEHIMWTDAADWLAHVNTRFMSGTIASDQ